MSPNIRRVTQFIAEARFMQHTYISICYHFRKPPWQRTDLCFNFRFFAFGCNPPTQFVPSPLSVTLAKNNTLGEVDDSRKQLGIITNVAGMVCDNAQTQTGHKSGLVK